MLLVIGHILVLDQGAEHRVALAQVMAIYRNVLAGLLIVGCGQGEQAPQLALFSREQVIEVIRCVIRAHDRIADRSPWDRKPGGKVFILRPAGGKIQAGSLQSTSMGR